MQSLQRKGFIGGWEPSGSVKGHSSIRRTSSCLSCCTSFLARPDAPHIGLANCPELYPSRRILRVVRPGETYFGHDLFGEPVHPEVGARLFRRVSRGGTRMKKTIAFAAFALSLISSTAMADQHRGGDAALWALSGAVVFGPIGAVAGAVVGYTAGPSIAHSWGFRRSSYARERRRSARQEAATAAPVETQPVPNKPATPPPPAPTSQAAPPPVPKTASTAPPVQGLE